MPTSDQAQVSGAFSYRRLGLYFRVSALEPVAAVWSEEATGKGMRWLGFPPRPFLLLAGGCRSYFVSLTLPFPVR